MDVQTIWSDDGIAIRMPEGEASLDGVEELLFPAAEDVEDLVVGQVANSALFASRFRENAARALLLPRRRPGTRTPLWQQRQRAARPARRREPLRQLPDPRRDVPRVPVGRVRPRRAARDPRRHLEPRDRGPRRRDAARPARSRAACCSTTSRRTCTTATRRWPSGGPGRSPWIATCSGSCSARRSSGSCSTPTPWPTSSCRCRRSSRTARRRRSTRSTTCCAVSATCPRTRSVPGPSVVPRSPFRG